MKAILKLTVAAACLLTTMPLSVSAQNAQTGSKSTEEMLSDHLFYLASDSLCGRKAGTKYSREASAYIVNQYEQIGVKPFFKEWGMPFERNGLNLEDKIGVIEGNDPVLKDEYIVLGAHFDHLGVKNGVVYNGADDNASGSSALIEIAREIYANRSQLKRSVIIAAFDGEEIGLFGSNALADTLAKCIGIDKIKLMMSIDMVGWYRVSGKLTMEGVATIKDGRELVSSEAQKYSINIDPVKFEKSVLTATDTEGFAKKGVPTLAVSTGLKSPYHKPEDDADLIDYAGLAKISDYVAAVTLDAASDPDFAGSGRVAKKHMSRLPRVQFGFIAGAGSSNLQLPNSSIQCKSGFTYDAGAQLQFNFGKVALVTRAFYEGLGSKVPDENDLYGSTAKYNQKSVTAPVMLQISAKNPTASYFLAAGGYYSHVFDSNISDLTLNNVESPEINTNQYGFQVSFGFRVRPLLWSVDFRRQLNGFFMDSSMPKAGLYTAMFTLGYQF